LFGIGGPENRVGKGSSRRLFKVGLVTEPPGEAEEGKRGVGDVLVRLNSSSSGRNVVKERKGINGWEGKVIQNEKGHGI